jgi:hypothetical protein
LYTGEGVRKIGSTRPNAMARMTKKGSTKNRSSQMVAGAANDGQNHEGNHAPRDPDPAPSGTDRHGSAGEFTRRR